MAVPSSPPERRSPRPLGRRFLALVGLLALASLSLEYGFYLPERFGSVLDALDIVLAACFGLDLVLALLAPATRARALRERWYEYVLLVLFLGSLELIQWLGVRGPVAELMAGLRLDSIAKLYLVLVQLYLLTSGLIALFRAQERLLGLSLRPETLLLGGFGGLVLVGTALLSLPRASAGPSIALLDAFFTSTSAVCVTGLGMLDTGGDLSLLGQACLAALIPLGGLGIMTFVSLGSILTGRDLSVPQMVALREMVSARTLSDVRRQVIAIILVALSIELVGAACLYLALPAEHGSAPQRAFWCLFHSISAFCNAGFALQPDSLVSLGRSAGVILTIATLIVVGGLGTPVLRDLLSVARARLDLLRARLRRTRASQRRARLGLQSKLSLLVTGVLLVLGLVGFWVLEAAHLLDGRPVDEAALASLFQSVTTRTAGFNSVPFDGLRDATLVLMIFLMVIGASPVSTGGGVKTATFAVLLLTLRAMLTGNERVEVLGRTIPARVVQSAISIFVLYVLAAGAAIFLLAITDPDMALQDQMFEVVSALSTVGLSTGITAALSAPGKLVVCALMFVGRVGPLTLVLSVFRASRGTASYQYPEEAVLLG